MLNFCEFKILFFLFSFYLFHSSVSNSVFLFIFALIMPVYYTEEDCNSIFFCVCVLPVLQSALPCYYVVLILVCDINNTKISLRFKEVGFLLGSTQIASMGPVL